jgi:hypothetical protein
VKKHSTSLALKEMQIKTTLRFYSTPAYNGCHQEQNNKSQKGCGEKGTLNTLLVGM